MSVRDKDKINENENNRDSTQTWTVLPPSPRETSLGEKKLNVQ